MHMFAYFLCADDTDAVQAAAVLREINGVLAPIAGGLAAVAAGECYQGSAAYSFAHRLQRNLSSSGGHW